MTVGFGWTSFCADEAALTMSSIVLAAAIPRWRLVGLRVLPVAWARFSNSLLSPISLVRSERLSS